MLRSWRRLAAAGLTALALLAVSVVPGAAYEVTGHGFHAFADRLAVVADRTAGNSPRVALWIIDSEAASMTVSVVFRSIDCAGTPRPANRVFALQASTDANGHHFSSRGVSSSIRFDDVKSAWVNLGHPRSTCARATQFLRVATGDVNGDSALGVAQGDGQLLGNLLAIVDYIDPDEYGLSLVVDGMGGNDIVRVRGVNRGCGTRPTRAFFDVTLTGVDGATTDFRTISMTAPQLRQLRSMRVSVGNARWCAPLSIIMANTEGDF